MAIWLTFKVAWRLRPGPRLWTSSPRADVTGLPAHSTPAGTVSGTVVAVLVGLIAWAAFAFKLHGLLIGIRPFVEHVAVAAVVGLLLHVPLDDELGHKPHHAKRQA